jgi:hypothetical protein
MENINNLPINVYEIIFSYLDYENLIKLSYINKNFRFLINIIFKNYNKYLKIKYIRFKLKENRFKLFFLKELKNDVILKLRFLNIKNKLSYTGYIDFIEKKDFDKLNTKILYGYDIHDRFFISFLFCIKYKKKIYNKIMTIFQRYIDDINYYLSCQDKLLNYPCNEKLYVKDNKIYSYNENFIKDVFTLLNNKKVIINENKNVYTYFFDVNIL